MPGCSGRLDALTDGPDDQSQLQAALAQSRVFATLAHERDLALRQAEARAQAAEDALRTVQASTSWRLLQAVGRRIPGTVRTPVPPPPTGPEPALHPDALLAELSAFLASDQRLAFPPCPAPDISVLITASGPAHLLLGCLRALLTQDGPAAELFVVPSDPGGNAVLARADPVRALPMADAATTARGRALLLLDPGAFPQPGALRAALETLDAGAGAVGGRILTPGGAVREAGGIVWSDGGLDPYGRGLPVQAGEAGFRRDTGFVPPGFLLTPLALFTALGGLDPAYASAEYASADYCARVRAAGQRVVYEPFAAVDHFGPLPQPPTAQDRMRFRAQHPAAPAALFARDPVRRRRLLVIDGFVPLRVMGAGYPRTQAILNEAAALGWAVTLYPLDAGDTGWGAARVELAPEIEICTGVGLRDFLRARCGFYNAVLVSRPEHMRVLRAAIGDANEALGGARLIYDAEALFSARQAQQAALEGRALGPDEQAALLAQEIALTRDVDAIVAVTPTEAAVFRASQPAPVHVLSHPVHPRPGPAFDTRGGFLFVGRLLERQSPNWDGLRWFINAVWLQIRAALPDAKLEVAGALHTDPAELRAPGISLLGPVDDLGPLYDRARVFVAPTRFGAGVPIKVLEAGAAGLPVLATSLIANQLGWDAGTELFAHDDPATLAAAGIQLHEESDRWTATQSAALARLGADHGAARFRETLGQILNGTPNL